MLCFPIFSKKMIFRDIVLSLIEDASYQVLLSTVVDEHIMWDSIAFLLIIEMTTGNGSQTKARSEIGNAGSHWMQSSGFLLLVNFLKIR